MNPHYAHVAARARHRCEYCRAPEVVFNFPFEVEHIVPASREGPDTEANRALACRSCNCRKGAYVTGTDPETGVVVHLFHPREDHWENHFRIDPGSGKIEGLTAIGRGTVARLAMNSEGQLKARIQWMRLGLFP